MKMNRIPYFISLLSALIFTLFGRTIQAQDHLQESLFSDYGKKEVMIPMRDGIQLYTAIYQPKDTTSQSPILIVRTPYSLAPYYNDQVDLKENYHVFLENNYILVFQNVRGTLMSEGEYEQVRPVLPHPKDKETDEATDSYDTVEWLLEHIPGHNGKVGFMGVSYDGFYATIASLCGHPAIQAVSPQAPIADWFMGDDVHMNGAFLNSIYSFGGRHFRARPHPVAEPNSSLVRPEADYYDYFLDKGPVSKLLRDFGDSLTFFNEIQQHPNYDSFWQRRCPLNNIKDIKPAMMIVGGWFDREDLYGTFATYKAVRRLSPRTEAYLVMGPWAHGSWRKMNYNHLGQTWFGEGSSRYFNEKILLRFFDRYLKDHYEFQIPRVQYLPTAETEEKAMQNVQTDSLWQTASDWPIPGIEKKMLYLGTDNDLRNQIVMDGKAARSYFSSPDRPVRCVGEVMDSWGSDQVTGDQSYLYWRSDVLSYTGEKLTDTLKVVGSVSAHLKVSVSTSDADMVVKLIDVRPDGYQMLVRWNVLPLRFRNSFVEPEPVIPGKVMDLKIRLEDVAHYFLPGHQLMIQIQSSMYPWVAMSPQTFMENPYLARRKDFKTSEITVYTNRNKISYITLPVLE